MLERWSRVKAERVFIDTNLFLRYLTNNVPAQADAVEALGRRALRAHCGARSGDRARQSRARAQEGTRGDRCRALQTLRRLPARSLHD